MSVGRIDCCVRPGPFARVIVEDSTVRPEESVAGRSDGALNRAVVAARTAEDNRGRDIVILDMRELTPVFDYFVLASGTSRRQLHAMSEEIDHALEEGLGDRRLGIEGYDESRWILLDYGDVVIHLFEPETRAYYALEQLWGQAKRVPFEPRNGADPSAEGPSRPK
ncbi:MAG: ribosome silencing factor [Pirellulales bacterium]|nr:ribosome silencing factor [Pirellulales bacterium]